MQGYFLINSQAKHTREIEALSTLPTSYAPDPQLGITSQDSEVLSRFLIESYLEVN